MDKFRLTAAVLLIVTAILHIAQPVLLGMTTQLVVVGVFGILYLLLGLGLFTKQRWILWGAIVLPTLGALGGLGDYLTSANQLVIFPLLLLFDVIIVPLCIVSLRRSQQTT